jgi:hypothetical protein
MSFPGFTAEVSVYTTQRHYSMAAHAQPGSGAISPALLISLVQPAACQPCFDDCSSTCSDVCSDLSGSAKVRCVVNCMRSCSKACGCNFFR